MYVSVNPQTEFTTSRDVDQKGGYGKIDYTVSYPFEIGKWEERYNSAMTRVRTQRPFTVPSRGLTIPDIIFKMPFVLTEL